MTFHCLAEFMWRPRVRYIVQTITFLMLFVLIMIVPSMVAAWLEDQVS